MLSQLAIPKKGQNAALDGSGAALDHEQLFVAGLQHIERLARHLWNDYNVHDPGITALELLCYAITDMSNRASLPMADLLTIRDNPDSAGLQFFTARTILPNRALTVADYRKLMIDVSGVQNAWIRPADALYYANNITGELLRTRPADPRGIVDVHLSGLYEAIVEFVDTVTADADRDAVLQAVHAKLHANRNLCEDFVSVTGVESEEFILCCELELTPDADIVKVNADVLFQVEEYLAPPVRQYSLSEMIARTRPDGEPYTIDQIFDGPALDHGFIPDDELEASALRTEVRLSDIISIIMDIPGVKAVRDIIISPAGSPGPLKNKWVIAVQEGKQALLNRDSWRIVSYKRGMPFIADGDLVRTQWDTLANGNAKVLHQDDLAAPSGKFRDPGAYYSFQNHFPELYGIGPTGAPSGADTRRRALANQLKGYLLHFDQLMADFMAQLSHVVDLFSTDTTLPNTYFYQQVATLTGYASFYRSSPDAVSAIWESTDAAPGLIVDRHNRFLDHLISRFAERFHDFAHIMQSEFGASPAAMIAYKCAFLQNYPDTSSGRSMAYNYTLRDDADLWNSTNVSGLEKRLAALLGLTDFTRRDLDTVGGRGFHDRGGATVGIGADPAAADPGDLADPADSIDPGDPGDPFDPAGLLGIGEPDDLDATVGTGDPGPAVDPGDGSSPGVDPGGISVDPGDGTDPGDGDPADAHDPLDLLPPPDPLMGLGGMYVIENILLRPEVSGDPFLPICPDANCTECFDEDPYSYRIHVVLPAYDTRFADPEYRRWAEQVIREETPAHIMPKICWISLEDMTELQTRYRDWLYLKAGVEPSARVTKLTRFINALFREKNIYSKQSLHECDSAEGDTKFILGQSALGTM